MMSLGTKKVGTVACVSRPYVLHLSGPDIGLVLYAHFRWKIQIAPLLWQSSDDIKANMNQKTV